jgi:hypothetical protein
MMEFLFTGLKILVLPALAWYIVQWYRSYRRLAHIPGPWLAGWSNLWLVGAIWRKRSHIEFYDMAEKHGDSPCPRFLLNKK